MTEETAGAAREQVARWAGLFDALAGSYDQSGVPFFGTIAEGLVDRLHPTPGERTLDVGAGRGAVTFRLAEAVGSTGRVDAIDIAPAMVELTGRAAAERGLDQVSVRVGDATDPARDTALEPGCYDVVASSLVLFFLPDPEGALRRWLPLLAPGGRVGASTFQPWPETWQAIDDLFAEYAAPGPAPTAMPEVYAHDSGVEELFARAGFAGVRTESHTFAVPFADVGQWRTWSMATAMRGLWMQAPDEAHDEITERVAGLLDRAGGSLDVNIRYTLGRR